MEQELIKKVLDALQPVLSHPFVAPPDIGSHEMRSRGVIDPIDRFRKDCESALAGVKE